MCSKAQQQEAARVADELKTALTKAERDLSFATIRAPIDGVVGNRAVQTGDFVQTGQRLATVVPLDDVYIDANLKETQLTRLRAGQKVEVTVDALPDRTIEGTVSSLAPASGSVFSLLPADNATGNFTKIVQRVPVRIRVPADVAAERLLRPACRWWCTSIPRPVLLQTTGPCRLSGRPRLRRFGDPRVPVRITDHDRRSLGRASVSCLVPPGEDRRRGRADRSPPIAGVLAMVFGMFMAILDIQIVSASLTEIQAGLAASSDEISWVQTAYLVAEVDRSQLPRFFESNT